MEKQPNISRIIALIPKLPNRDVFHMRKEWEEAARRSFDTHAKRSPRKALDLLFILMTPSEKRDFLMRIGVLKSLVQGKSYRKITFELGISQQTIAAIRKVMLNPIYISYHEHSKTHRKKKPHWPAPDTSARRDPLKRPHKHKYGTAYW